MKHNNMRDIEAEIRFNARAERLKRDAKHAHDKKLSRNPVTTDSDDYKARYDEAMALLERALYIANDFSTVNATAHNIVLGLIRKKNELRDSE